MKFCIWIRGLIRLILPSSGCVLNSYFKCLSKCRPAVDCEYLAHDLTVFDPKLKKKVIMSAFHNIAKLKKKLIHIMIIKRIFLSCFVETHYYSPDLLHYV